MLVPTNIITITRSRAYWMRIALTQFTFPLFILSLPSNIMLFFTTTFLTLNHIYSIFASDSPIVSNGIATDQSLNLTHALARRVVVPPDQQCDQIDDWLERRCLTDEHGYGGWVDKCMDDSGYAYEKVDSCPIGMVCRNTRTLQDPLAPNDYGRTIYCRPRHQRRVG